MGVCQAGAYHRTSQGLNFFSSQSQKEMLLLSLAGCEQVLSAQHRTPSPVSSTDPAQAPPSGAKTHDFIHNLYQMLKLGPWDPEPAVMLHCP